MNEEHQSSEFLCTLENMINSIEDERISELVNNNLDIDKSKVEVIFKDKIIDKQLNKLEW